MVKENGRPGWFNLQIQHRLDKTHEEKSKGLQTSHTHQKLIPDEVLGPGHAWVLSGLGSRCKKNHKSQILLIMLISLEELAYHGSLPFPKLLISAYENQGKFLASLLSGGDGNSF